MLCFPRGAFFAAYACKSHLHAFITFCIRLRDVDCWQSVARFFFFFVHDFCLIPIGHKCGHIWCVCVYVCACQCLLGVVFATNLKMACDCKHLFKSNPPPPPVTLSTRCCLLLAFIDHQHRPNGPRLP